jgi:hypothetical protein
MNVQLYLEQHGLEKLQEEFFICVNDYGDFCVLNYSQIDSPRFHPICDECRSLILEKNTWKILSRSFDRFYNYQENPNDKDFPIDKALVQEKVDGCCDADTILITRNGPKTIREICEEEEQIEILAYNIDTEENVWTKALAFSIQRNNNDWFEIEIENGETIRLTGNHYIWLPNYKCYRQVKNLKVGDDILVK